MKISFDKAKDEKNIEQRSLSFEMVVDLDWDNAVIWEDTRKAYGEQRFIAAGYIGKRLHMVVFTRREEIVRVISLHKANITEVKKYG